MMEADGSLLRTGEVALSAGVSADTVRHYERLGLIPRARRSPAGYRQYSQETCRRMRVIRAALALGFTLRELGQVLSQRDRGGAPCQRVRDLAARRLEDVQVQLRRLVLTRRRLRAALHNWDRRLATAREGDRAYLLESLVEADPARS